MGAGTYKCDASANKLMAGTLAVGLSAIMLM